MAFLNSGTTLHPILAKSQCWCVDGVSKFALRISQIKYYRIELPYVSPLDQEKVEEFKNTLAKLLQYEVTPCPFKRGFKVDLPEPPKTPILKKPWRPKPLVQASPEIVSERLEDFGDFGPLVEGEKSKKSNPSLDEVGRFSFKLENANVNNSHSAQSDVSSTAGSGDEQESQATSSTCLTPGDTPDHLFEENRDFKTPTRPKPMRTGRTVTAPPQLSLRRLPPSIRSSNDATVPNPIRDTSSLSSSVDSFHSFHSPISPLPPSPPFNQPAFLSTDTKDDLGIDICRTRNHNHDVSEITVTSDRSELWDMSSSRTSERTENPTSAGLPRTPTLISDAALQDENHWPEAINPSPPADLRFRTNKSRRRAQSPLPSSTNLYSPYSPRQHMSGHHLTTAILQRTCSLLMGPPVQLVALMLRIAAKIAKSTFRGSSFGFGEPGQKIPCSWDFSSDESDEMWEEDDFGVSLSKAVPSKNGKAKDLGGSWEID